MAPVSCRIIYPTIVFNCVLSIFVLVFFFSYFLSLFFLFLFCYVFFYVQLSCPFLTILFIFSFVFDFNGFVLCFDIFKQFCYLAKCFVNTCKMYKYAKLKASS